MNLTVDASVFVAAIRQTEMHNAASVEFLEELRTHPRPLYCPTLVLTESVAAIGRATGDAALVQIGFDIVQTIPDIRLIPLDLDLARRAADLAASQRLRGADAVYLAVAQLNNSTLITWDAEMLQRGPAVLPTLTPSDWLVAAP